MVSFIFAAALGELILDDGDVDIDVEETSKKLNSILFYCWKKKYYNHKSNKRLRLQFLISIKVTYVSNVNLQNFYI